jgi:putative transposase
MKTSKFTDAQKAFIIRLGEDGTPVEEICRKAGITAALASILPISMPIEANDTVISSG